MRRRLLVNGSGEYRPYEDRRVRPVAECQLRAYGKGIRHGMDGQSKLISRGEQAAGGQLGQLGG
jgi:hypothetical protein